jgi:uncharacterized protein YhaN
MHLNELQITDFGCFRRARLENLDDDLVVIGGPQRAGKTTFMQALRQFPEGVGRGGDIPPATDDYLIDAEITYNGQQYQYLLSGYASPSISPIDDGPRITESEIFGPVTERQYRNIYTISLDELRRLPPDIDDSEDLAQILLGGAYGDIAEIPDIEDMFDQKADDIGLSRGDPSTKTSELNNPYQRISQGIKARTEASQQVDEYETVTGKIDKKRSEEEEIESEIKRRQRIRDRLNVLKELFESLQNLDRLNARLEDINNKKIEEFPTHLTDRLEHFEEEFDEVTEELNTARQQFDRSASMDSIDEYYEWLLEHEVEIGTRSEDRKLLDSTAENLVEREESLESERRDIEREISSLYSGWDESFSHIDEIETNTVDTARVTELASTIDDLESERSNRQGAIDSSETQKQELQEELEDMEKDHEETKEVTLSKRKPAIVAGVAILVGTGIGFVLNPLIGGIVGLLLLVVGFYTIDSTTTVETDLDADPYREIKGQITNLEADIQADSDRLTELNGEIEEQQAELNSLVTKLGLPEKLPTSEVPEFYVRIVELDQQITAHRDRQAEFADEKDEFTTDIQEVTSLLEDVVDLSWTAEKPLEGVDEVITTLEAIAADLELARDVRTAERQRTEKINDIDDVLTEWDDNQSVDSETDNQEIRKHIQAFYDEAERIGELESKIEERDQIKTRINSRLENESAREAFNTLREADESWIDVVRDAAMEHADTDAIANEIREQKTEIEQLEDERDELRDECAQLVTRKEELASEEDLREARAQIEEGRVEFERLGESYAVNRIAESMVSQLHERLMEDVVHSLVDDASDIFAEITQTYDGIELNDDVQNLDFRALREDKSAHSITELSRATGEQLFLAIRLARIRQTDVSLPVVIDDAATNFDPDHMRRVFEVIDQLSETNQVFFLTCHPQCVNVTASADLSVQYWSIEDGNFISKGTADSLQKQLSAD